MDYIGAGADDKEIERGPALFGNMNFQVRRAGTLRADGSGQANQLAPFSLQDVLHVTVFPPRHDLHTAIHWSKRVTSKLG